MASQAIFQTQLILGYVACLLLFGTYILPRLRVMDRFSAQRVIATIHSFPASAASGRPNTGAATYVCPAARCRSARRRESPGLMVLIET